MLLISAAWLGILSVIGLLINALFFREVSLTIGDRIIEKTTAIQYATIVLVTVPLL